MTNAYNVYVRLGAFFKLFTIKFPFTLYLNGGDAICIRQPQNSSTFKFNFTQKLILTTFVLHFHGIYTYLPTLFVNIRRLIFGCVIVVRVKTMPLVYGGGDLVEC